MTPQLPAVRHGHLQSSNSTASIFLGGVRRSWMDNPRASRLPAIPLAPSVASASPPAAAVAATTATAAAPPNDPPRPDMRHPALVPTASTCRSQQNNNDAVDWAPQPPPQPHPQALSQSRPLPQPQPQPQQPQSQPDPRPPSTLVAPITTSSHPQPAAPAAPDPPPPPVTLSTTLPSLPTQPFQPSQPSPTASLSLANLQVSSARPLDSPTNVPSRVNLPRPTPLQVNAGVPTPPPTRTSGGAGDVSQSPLNNVAMQIPSSGVLQPIHPQSVQTSHAHPHVPAVAAHRSQQQQQPQQQEVQPYHHRRQPRQRRPSNAPSPSTFVPAIDDAFFEHSIGNLNNFQAYLERIGVHPQTVEFARLQLLSKACISQDTLYLVIHQMYCLYSFAPAQFFEIPCYTQLQAMGLGVIEKVMVSNNQMSPDFLRWCAHFPSSITVLLQTPAYQQAAQKAAQCLGQLAEQWTSFIQHVFARGFPPFVSELMGGLSITSERLAYTIFLSTCRQLPGPTDETALFKVWRHDVQNFQRRQQRQRSGGSITKNQIREENAEVIRLYQLIPVPNRPAVSAPRPQGQQHAPSPRPAAPRPIVSATTSALVRPTGIPSPQPSQSPQMPGTTAQPAVASPRMAMATGTPNVAPMPAQAPRRGRPRIHHPPSMSPAVAPGTGGVSPQMGRPFQMVFPSQLVQSLASPRQAPSPTQRPLPMPAQPQIPMGVRPNGVLSPGGPRALPSQQQQLQQQQQPPRFVHPSHARPPPHRAPAPAPRPQPLLPPPGHKPSTTSRPHPLRDALHQAHLRGPVNEVQAPQDEQEAGLFQYVSGFAVKPKPLGSEACSFAWQFELSRSDLDRVPASHIPLLGQRAVRAYKDGSQIHRLRCIRVSPTAAEVSEQTWCTAEATWPSVIYVFINDAEAYVRRRVHNGKDLPLDISHYLREGLNTVTLHFIRSVAETQDLTYAMAIEVLDIVSFSRAKKLAKPLASAESREQIRTRLSPGAQDDEVSIVSDNLTVDLVDPFMAKVFNTPVRGRFCGHQECFDHDTWILTRASKSGNAPMKEDWKCPICHQDARPQSLVVDGFLVEVHEELARTDRLETARAIQVKADGSWQVRAETEASDRSGPERTASKRKLTGANGADSPAPKRPKVEQGPSSLTNGNISAQPIR